MQLTLRGVTPIPLRDKINTYTSGIWKQDKTFSKGQYVFVQAPSGTGKTTLVHTLYGLRKDYEGDVLWNGQKLADTSSGQLAAIRMKHVSVIFQDMRLFPELTAWENIEVKRKLTNTVTEQEAAKWMERLGIADKRNSQAATMSYGEQQRAAIIRALLQPFDWLLMDEPFSHLDAANTHKAIELVQEVVKRNNAGLILADLDPNEYFEYTQAILL